MNTTYLWTYWIVGFFIFQIFHFLSTWKLYQKAGRKPYEAIIPFYNMWIMLKVIKRPFWWFFLLFVPMIFTLMYLVIWIDFIRCFGKRSNRDALLVIFSFGLYITYLNYSKNISYIEVEERKETMLSALIFAVVFASFIHTYFIQPFTIPTPSMERSLLVGDFMFVSKIHYGLRIPITPIGIPFTHNTFPILGTKSYLDKIRLPYMRLPALENIKRNDIVVFNYPIDFVHSPDRKDNYIKRCVALPGDLLQIRDGNLIVNEKQEELPIGAQKQYSYIIKTKNFVSLDFLKEELKIKEVYSIGSKENPSYQVMITKKKAQKIKSYDFISSIQKHILHKEIIEEGMFPLNAPYNRDFYGPLYVPKKGDLINLSKENIENYRTIITHYEKNELKEENDKFYINNIETNQYKIAQNYYFMMGDNRHNSLDSRYFGFVPEDHIIGKPIFIWMSIDWNRNQISNIFEWKLRWNRIMTLTNENSKEKTSYLKYVLGGLVIYFAYNFLSNRKKKKRAN